MKKKCSHCGKDFKANHGKQKFCSDKCKVAANRAKNNSITSVPIIKELIKAVGDNKLTTADKIPPPSKKKQPHPEVIIEGEYGSRFLELCKMKKVTPEDMFVWIEENYGKKPAPLKSVFGRGKEKEPRHDGARYDRRKEKLGFSATDLEQ